MTDRDLIRLTIASIDQMLAGDVICPDVKAALSNERQRLALHIRPVFNVEPIDIDFAGWSIVPEGEHNAWGIINVTENTLYKWVGYSCRDDAVEKCGRLNQS
jgi:hypothetical protein